MSIKRTMMLVALLSVAPLVCNRVEGQQEIRHGKIRGDMAPGMAAYFSQMQDRDLIGHVQAVRIISPPGSRISVWSGEGFMEMNASKTKLGMSIGPVYRLKVDRIPKHFDKAVYPSIEMVNRLTPPEGMENKFPVEIVLSEDDLEQAVKGRFVTKVIYLEDPESAIPKRKTEGDQPFFDIGAGDDPYRTADRLGRPMAIVRIGSRAPLYGDKTDQFGFDNPTPMVLEENATPVHVPRKWEALDNLDAAPSPSDVVPPIIPGQIYNGDQ